MKKLFTILLLSMICAFSAVSFAACGVNFKINFIADDEIYATVSTNGGETIKMPDNPVKEDYTFDGWFWDKDVWEKPFTANSLLDAPLSSDMSVYAKFTKKHEHNYIASVKEPTCTEKGYTTYTCACGESYTGDSVNELGHDYNATVTDPTCTEQGYTTHTCLRCKDSYIDTYTNALNHDYGDWTLTKAPTCTETGIETRYCSHDNTHTETRTVNKLDHEFTNYVYDNNATYDEDGTKTAVCDRGCGATNTVTAENTKLKSEIVFRTLTVDEELNVYGKVANTKTTFSFINEVEVKGNATFVVSTDIYGMQQIPTKTVPIEIGDNTFYITETVGSDIKLFTVTVRRKPVYTVSFNTDGGTKVDIQHIEEDDFATEPTTTKAGYTFTGWNYDFTNPIIKNTTATASWTANTNTPYKVEYYLQNLENDDYTLYETENLTGTTDTTANAEIKVYEHFTHTTISESKESGNINADGTTVLRVYYTRDIYEFTVTNENTKGGAIDCTDNGSYRYEKQIDLSATINAGYDFVGWFNGDNQVSTESEYSFTLNEKTDITAKYSAHNNTKYTIETYLENLDGTYTKQSTEEKFGKTDTTATVTPNAPEHYTLNSDKSILSDNINGNSGTTLKVYYTRNIYVYNFQQKNERDDIINDITVYNCKYGKTITLYATLDGYDFIGWFNGDKNLSYELQYSFNISENVTIIAKYLVHKNTKYIIQCFIENLDGSYTKQSTEEKYGETNTIATVIPNPAPEHFIFNSNKSVLSKNINGDGSTTLKIYYDLERFKINIYASSNNVTLNTTYDGYYRYGDFIPEISATYNDYVGCQWNGWYINDTFKTFDFTIPSFMVDKNIDYCAKGEKEEMANFIFISTTSTCEIIGIKNTNVKTIVIPKYVTKINRGALSGCSLLEEISIPFVGAYRAAKNEEAMFGYIFGYKKYAGAVLIGQEYNSFGTFYNYIPSSLKSVIVTGDRIFNGAFSNCDMLTVVTIGSSVMSIGKLAFSNCKSLTDVIFENTNGWKYATKSDMSDAWITEPFILANSKGNANGFTNSSRNFYWQRG